MARDHSFVQGRLPQKEVASMGSRPRAFTFVQLVFEAQTIVVGSVSQKRDAGPATVTISVRQSFPSGPPRTIQVKSISVSELLPRFTPGQKVVLFLSHVDESQAVLLGDGDVGVWPRAQADWLFSSGHVTGPQEVVRIVELLFKVEAGDTCEQRAKMLLEEVIPAGTLGQIAAVEYAADTARWKNARAASDFGYSDVRLLVAERLMLDAQPHDSAAVYGLLQLLSDAPSTVAVPYLLEHLDSSDAAVRDTAFTSLQTVALPYMQDTFGYSSASAAQVRADAISRWREWWHRVRAMRLRVEVPAMLAGLSANSLLKRESSNRALQLISYRNFGYDARAAEEQRKAAIQKWQDWWAEESRQLVDR